MSNTGQYRGSRSRRYRNGSSPGQWKRRRLWRRLRDLILLAVCAASVFLGYQVTDRGWLSGGRHALTQDESEASQSLADSAQEHIPEYAGEDTIVLNENIPSFSIADLTGIQGEQYSEPDALGRCRTAAAMLDGSMMPTQERGEIGEIRPTGWKQNRYPGIVDFDPPFLYNRCHLIAYALTGQNANERNLITGTHYMNATLMLPYEQEVIRYLENSNNHVLYRVSPYYRGNELLARGVEMEAYSVEDSGQGVCFHVFVYNVQPGVKIDYQTGENRLAE